LICTVSTAMLLQLSNPALLNNEPTENRGGLRFKTGRKRALARHAASVRCALTVTIFGALFTSTVRNLYEIDRLISQVAATSLIYYPT
jgi:hypothetical protein